MSAVNKMSNVAIAMQSALGTAKTIDAITKAAPGIITSVAHGYVNGDYIFLEIQGMAQLNNRVFRVIGQTVDNFELEDTVTGTSLDTSALQDFSSGTAKKITFGNSITSATTIDSSGGDFDFEDTTLIHTNVKSQVPTSANPITKSMELLWDVENAGQIALKAASDAQSQLAFRLTYGNGGAVEVFIGYVGFTGAPTGAAQGVIKSPATITAFGAASYYSS